MATERREHSRFLPKDTTYAVLGRENSKMGMIKDISIGGLAFDVIIDDDFQTEIMPKVDIFMEKDEFALSNIPCTIMYKRPLQTDSTSPTLIAAYKSGRYGLRFAELTKDQTDKLIFFIKNHTAEISATQTQV